MSGEIEDTILHYRKQALDLVARYESANVSELQSDLREAMDRRIRVLELGCGSGRDAAFLKKYGNIGTITATDGSPEMLKEAAKLHPFIAGDLKELVLPHGLEALVRAGKRFTGIFSVATLMHLSPEDVEETLRLTDMLLEPAGILFLSVCIKRDIPQANDHRVFTIKPDRWWRKQIEEIGLRVVEMKKTGDGLSRPDTQWLNITAVR